MLQRLFMLLALLGSLVTGCAVRPDLTPPPDRRVTIASDLASDVAITGIRCVRGVGGCLSFQAEAVNHTTADCGVEWRIAWLDASGIEIESVTGVWRKLMISPQDIVALTASATTQAAVDFRFYLRKLRR